MQQKIAIRKIESKDTDVYINSNSHTIEEIKKEIRECFYEPQKEFSQVPVYEFWPEE